MTDLTETGRAYVPLQLPGLETVNPEYGYAASPLRTAVEATLKQLEQDGLLTERHVGIAMLALELADAVVAGRRAGRASAVAMAARELRETLQALPAPAEQSQLEIFQQLVVKLDGKDAA
jgi:succinate dehydrogenase/fumarate reductase flavoprotein subunit